MALRHLTPAIGTNDPNDQISVDAWNEAHEIDIDGITMPVHNTRPIEPSPGYVTVFGSQVSNRVFPAFVGPSGLDVMVQPFLARNKIGLWNPPGNAATAPGVFGFGTPTLVSNGGTALVARNVATTNFLTRMRRAAITTTATAGTLASFRVPAAQYTTGNGVNMGGFHTVIRFGVSDAAAVSGARMFIGMSSSTAAATNVEPSTLTNCFGVAQLSTDATQFYFVYGGSAAQTAIPLGTAIGAPTLTNTAFELSLYCPPSGNGVINYQLLNLSSEVSVSGTITPTTPGTQTPANTTLLTHQIWRTNNAAAVQAAIDLCSIYIETDQ